MNKHRRLLFLDKAGYIFEGTLLLKIFPRLSEGMCIFGSFQTLPVRPLIMLKNDHLVAVGQEMLRLFGFHSQLSFLPGGFRVQQVFGNLRGKQDLEAAADANIQVLLDSGVLLAKNMMPEKRMRASEQELVVPQQGAYGQHLIRVRRELSFGSHGLEDGFAVFEIKVVQTKTPNISGDTESSRGMEFGSSEQGQILVPIVSEVHAQASQPTKFEQTPHTFMGFAHQTLKSKDKEIQPGDETQTKTHITRRRLAMVPEEERRDSIRHVSTGRGRSSDTVSQHIDSSGKSAERKKGRQRVAANYDEEPDAAEIERADVQRRLKELRSSMRI